MKTVAVVMLAMLGMAMLMYLVNTNESIDDTIKLAFTFIFLIGVLFAVWALGFKK